MEMHFEAVFEGIVSERLAHAATQVTGESRSREWRDNFVLRLAISVLLVLIWVVFGVQIAWFRFDAADVHSRAVIRDLAASYSVLSAFIICSRMLLLGKYSTRRYWVLGTEPEKYKFPIYRRE